MVLSDPALLRAARQIYDLYYQHHAREAKRPIGVVVDPETYRGQVVFGQKPILLPGECFVPINKIESELY